MDGLAQPLPHSGLEAGGGYGPMRNLVPAGGGHLVQHWHSCLSGSLSPGRPLPALGYQQRLGSYNPYCHFIVASSQPLPALILMLAPPPDTLPSKGFSGPEPVEVTVDRLLFPIMSPPSLLYWGRPGGCAHFLCCRARLPGAVTTRRWLTKYSCVPNSGEP